jgi:ligand-binding sensor domain-containing protein
VGLPSNYLNAVALAPNGALWFGTEGQGAARYDGKTWKTYGIQDSLLSNSIDGIYAEPNGAVWFATTGGITRLEP